MVLLTPLFIGLGVWQLDRAEQKRNLAQTLETRRKQPAVFISANLPLAEQLAYRQVIATGHFLADKTVLIENRKHQGSTGLHVITPLQLADSDQLVLVNRGWISRQQAADPTRIPTPAGELTITGQASIPEPPALALELRIEPDELAPHWPYLTLAHYTAWSGQPVLPFLILQAPADDSGFVRQWPAPQADDSMHIGYALQWFAFALIALLIWLRLAWHKSTEQTS
jgi:surfeit locus 1 family protein